MKGFSGKRKYLFSNTVRVIIFWIITLLLIGCQSLQPLTDVIPTEMQAPLPSSTPMPSLTPFTALVLPSSTPTVTPTITKTATPTSTPFDLLTFQTKKILRNVLPQTYIVDQCQYLAQRWSESKSEPGTIVVPVMYHSIRQAGKPVNDTLTVSHEYFEATMQHAKQLGFETITSQQLVDFLYENKAIPRLSMILIVDDRRLGVVRDHFMPILDKNNWTVTLAYITGIATDAEWQEMASLNSDNRLDLQAHGFLHNGTTYFTEFTPPETIHDEIYKPIDVIQAHSGKRPVAFIWPGGNFTQDSVLAAEQAGYKIGFTVFARGPLMFNWIPLGNDEIAMNNPLLVLPRYWSTTAYINLDEALEISTQASLFAEQNRAAEYQWYQAFCDNSTPLPTYSEGEIVDGS